MGGSERAGEVLKEALIAFCQNVAPRDQNIVIAGKAIKRKQSRGNGP